MTLLSDYLASREISMDLERLIARAVIIDQYFNKEILEFVPLLLAFLLNDDKVSRWFQSYIEQKKIDVTRIMLEKLNKKTFDYIANYQLPPLNILIGTLSLSTSAKDFLDSAMIFHDELLKSKGLEVNISHGSYPLNVHHLMGAIIYTPSGHANQLEWFGLVAVDLSRSFLDFIGREYPNEFVFWSDRDHKVPGSSSIRHSEDRSASRIKDDGSSQYISEVASSDDDYSRKIQAKIEKGEPVEFHEILIIADLDIEKFNLPKENNKYIIKSDIKITKSFLEGSVKFNSAILKGQVNFEGSTFNKTVDFSGSQFKNNAIFNRVKFDGDANFVGTEFKGIAEISDAKFKNKDDEELVKKLIESERELEINPYAIPDHTTDNRDLLNFTVYAKALADFISNKKTKTPITIGIDAAWGMGKTTLMEMICFELVDELWCKKCKRCDRSPKPSHGDENNGINAEDRSGDIEGIPRSKDKDIDRDAYGEIMAVWFNAWKYDQEASLWAALTLEILRQISLQFGLRDRLWMGFKLNSARFSREQLLESMGKALFFGAIVLVIAFAVSIPVYYLKYGSLNNWISQSMTHYGLAPLLFVIAFFAATFKDIYSRLVGPFDLKISQYLQEPNYRERIGFLGEFEDDFKQIIKIITQDGKKTLVIFIDDLDRCSPPKPAEVIEAINILLDSKYCAFVIGMDGKAVASSIEAKYLNLREYLDKTGDPSRASLGQRFLDKIIQVSFRIPIVESNFIKGFYRQILSPMTDATGKNGKPENTHKTEQISGEAVSGGMKEKHAEEMGSQDKHKENLEKKRVKEIEAVKQKFAEDFDTYLDVQDAIDSAQPYLVSNPRRIKRFLNNFRLLALIANRRDLLHQRVIRLDLLAIWVVILTRWPDIIDTLETDGQFMSRLRQAQVLKRDLDNLRLMNEQITTVHNIPTDSNTQRNANENTSVAALVQEKKEALDIMLTNPKIERMVDEFEFTYLVDKFGGQLQNYIYLAKVA
jgi:hypothetical protein